MWNNVYSELIPVLVTIVQETVSTVPVNKNRILESHAFCVNNWVSKGSNNRTEYLKDKIHDFITRFYILDIKNLRWSHYHISY